VHLLVSEQYIDSNMHGATINVTIVKGLHPSSPCTLRNPRFNKPNLYEQDPCRTISKTI